MQRAIKVSVVIPVFNEEDQLEDCLSALDAQTVQPAEVIVVDNNSTDKSVEIAKKYKARVIKETQKGVLYARNTGFDNAKFEIIGRLDADSRVDSDWIERLITDFEDTELAAVGGPNYYYDQPSSRAGLRMDIQVRKELNRSIKGYGVFLQGANMAVRKSAWESVKKSLCLKENFHEDVDLALHLYEQGYKIIFDERLVVGASSRRMNSSVRDFYKYNQMTVNNYKKHKLPTEKINMFIAFMMIIQQPIRVMYRFYDEKTGRLSITKALKYLQADSDKTITTKD